MLIKNARNPRIWYQSSSTRPSCDHEDRSRFLRSKFELCEQISKVTVTNQFTVDYMRVFRRYGICAKLINRMK